MTEKTPKFEIDEVYDLTQKISQSFSPSAPIDQKALFAGRIQQIVDVITAVGQKGQHVILYGERGVGKTSLATVISAMNKGNALTMRSTTVNCDQTMTFSSLWRTALREIAISTGQKNGIGFHAETEDKVSTLADFLPEVVTPDEIRYLLQKVGKTIIILDELDRIVDKKITSQLADTIKNLSDHAVDTTLILVGVADSVSALIGEHQSVERALVQIRMPRMTRQELIEIIDKGAKNSGMTITGPAKSRIALLSQGLPHYAHLLALHAFQSAVSNFSYEVNAGDVKRAIEKALTNAQQSAVAAYHKATTSARENLYPQVLLACALAKPDELGYFAAADVREPMSEIMGKQYEIPAFAQHLNAFCEPVRGPILQRLGEVRRYRYRFINPLMQPYIVMAGVSKGLIKEETLEKA